MIKTRLLTLLALLMTAATGAWADETPLVTIESKDYTTFKSGSKTFDDMVTITFSNTVSNAGNNNGWYATNPASLLTVAGTNGYTITSCKFYTNDGTASTGYTVEGESPSVYLYNAKVYTDANQSETIGFYGIKKIEVYGAAPAGYTVSLKDGVKDADKWTISPNPAPEGSPVTIQYSGRLKVKGVKATSDAAPAKEPVTLATPLTIEAITPGTIVVDIDGTLSKGMKYSVNGGTKTLITTTKSIEGLKAGDKVQFYGNGTQTQVYGGYTEVSILGIGDGFKTKVYGNIMSLLDEEGFATKTDLPNAQNVFYGLFKGNTTLNDASELLLPATTLAERCYFGMFTGCTSLTTAPKLPATTLAYQCYYSMFLSCTSLTNAYVKAAFTAGNAECNGMFEDCSAAGAVLHTTPGNKASWEAKMGSGKDWENWSVADDWQE